MKKIHAIVLAAGLSRRMGKKNKLLLPFRKQSILGEVLSQLSQTEVQGITVVLGHEREAIKKVLIPFAVNTIFNPDFASGQSSSIQAGVKALPKEADGFMICLGDMPTLTSTPYQKLIDQFQKALSENPNTILRPFCKDQPGHPVCFARKYQSQIFRSPENDGCRAVILHNKKELTKWETEEAAYFLDVDTEESYKGLVLE